MRATVGRARIRRSLITYLGAAALVLIVVAVGTTLVGRQVAQDEALRDAERTAQRTASLVVAPLLTDVERGDGRLFAVSQGDFPADGQAGMPATPDTGSLVRAQGGGFVTIAHPIDRPTSLEIVGTTAYVVTLGGDVIEVDHVDR